MVREPGKSLIHLSVLSVTISSTTPDEILIFDAFSCKIFKPDRLVTLLKPT